MFSKSKSYAYLAAVRFGLLMADLQMSLPQIFPFPKYEQVIVKRSLAPSPFKTGFSPAPSPKHYFVRALLGFLRDSSLVDKIDQGDERLWYATYQQQSPCPVHLNFPLCFLALVRALERMDA